MPGGLRLNLSDAHVASPSLPSTEDEKKAKQRRRKKPLTWNDTIEVFEYPTTPKGRRLEAQEKEWQEKQKQQEGPAGLEKWVKGVDRIIARDMAKIKADEDASAESGASGLVSPTKVSAGSTPKHSSSGKRSGFGADSKEKGKEKDKATTGWTLREHLLPAALILLLCCVLPAISVGRLKFHNPTDNSSDIRSDGEHASLTSPMMTSSLEQQQQQQQQVAMSAAPSITILSPANHSHMTLAKAAVQVESTREYESLREYEYSVLIHHSPIIHHLFVIPLAQFRIRQSNGRGGTTKYAIGADGRSALLLIDGRHASRAQVVAMSVSGGRASLQGMAAGQHEVCTVLYGLCCVYYWE
jgi:hypothetical protein